MSGQSMADEARAFREMPDAAYADVMNGRTTAEEAISAQISRPARSGVNPTPPQEAYAALEEWAEAYANMWDCADSFHGSLTMTEVFAQARLLRAAGRPDLAGILLREWTLIEHAEHELDDGKREMLAEIVAVLPEIPDHREDGSFNWTPYITPEEDA